MNMLWFFRSDIGNEAMNTYQNGFVLFSYSAWRCFLCFPKNIAHFVTKCKLKRNLKWKTWQMLEMRLTTIPNFEMNDLQRSK